MKKIISLLLGLSAGLSYAHAPFVAPQQFIVEGGDSAFLAGFAEKPFDSEVAIRGFEFHVMSPQGELKPIHLINSQTISVGDVVTAQQGSYQILGQRIANIKYAKLDSRWLRVLDPKGAPLAPLAEREFIAEAELTAQTPQVSITRYDDVVSYFSKAQASALHSMPEQNLQVAYSTHPNQLSTAKPLNITVSLNGKAVPNLKVELEKQQQVMGEKTHISHLSTNSQGQAELKFPQAGRYIVTLSSAEPDPKTKPSADVYRTVISLEVSE